MGVSEEKPTAGTAEKRAQASPRFALELRVDSSCAVQTGGEEVLAGRGGREGLL